MKTSELGNEIYRVKRSKFFGHIRDYLLYIIAIYLICVGIYANNLKGAVLVIISLTALMFLLNKKFFRKVIFYKNGFLISILYSKKFLYTDLNAIYTLRARGLFLRDIGSISISFEFKKIFDRFLYEIDTSLIKKEEAKKIIEIFQEKGVKYVEFENAKLQYSYHYDLPQLNIC